MGIWFSFKTGLNVTKRFWKMLLLLFIINFAAALLLTMPLKGFIDRTIGNKMAVDEIAWNWDFDYLFDWLINYNDAFTSTYSPSFIMTAILLYVLVSTFLVGGILGSFGSGEKFSLKSFFGYCGNYFWAFFRLLLISLIFFALVILIYSLIGQVFSSIMEDSPNEPLVFVLWVIQHVIFLFLFLFVNMVFDYAKIRAVLKNERSMWRVALGSFLFVFRNFGRTLGLYYLIGLFAVVLFAAYFSVVYYIIPATLVIGLFIWHRLYRIARIGIRMLFFSGQLDLYRTLT